MRKLTALLAGTAVGAAACVSISPAASAARPAVSEAKSARLSSFTTCQGMLRYAKRHARDLVGPFGLEGSGGVSVLPVGAEGDATSVARGAPAGFSGTNVQETGVDEPDVVKSDGSRLFAVAQGRLYSLDVSGPAPRLLASRPLGEGSSHELLLAGDRLLVVSTGGYGIGPVPLAPEVLPAATVLTELDVGDPAALRVVRTLSVDGAYVSARLVGSTARIVLTSTPEGFRFATPKGSRPEDAKRATRRNRAVIASSTLRRWVPAYTLRNRRTGKVSKGLLARCSQIWRPQTFSGLGLLTVLTIDLEQGLQPADSDAVMTGGDTVYASPTGLYVATQRWVDPEIRTVPGGMTTALHKFDVSAPAQTAYRASGEVPGFLLNQWSLSEREGFLRVATTEAPAWLDEAGESESAVSVLEERSGALVTVGRVGGLGRGERVYAVRFIDDMGYVVTFRQTDPLFTVDLSDPAHPAVLGELELLGYSAYLHPIGDGLLLGIGQDATSEGRTLGTQVSVFDVSDPRKPARLHHRSLGPGWSEAEVDHHAFLFWPPSRLAVLPLQTLVADEASGGERVSSGAVGLRVGAAGIEHAGTVSHEGDAPIRRSLVVGDTLLTVSERGVEASSLDTLVERFWVAFR